MNVLTILILAAVIYYLLSKVTKSTTDKEPHEFSSAPRQEMMGNIQGSGRFEFDVVGESHYQDALESIAGPKDEDGKDYECMAELLLEDGNRHDSQAVLVAIEGNRVGYLSRQHAREFRAELNRQGLNVRTCRVPALIVGGWKRGLDVGHFGVKLDLPLAD